MRLRSHTESVPDLTPRKTMARYRYQVFGVGVNEKVFIAGGLGEFPGPYLKTCKVY